MDNALMARALGSSLDDVRRAYIVRVRAERVRAETALIAAGYERVVADDPVTEDGREVVRVGGTPYALRRDVHANQLAAALQSAKRAQVGSDTKSVVGTESLSQMVCPKCGDSLQHTSVCPKCAAGKLGYRHRYTCVCGGVDLISKDKL